MHAFPQWFRLTAWLLLAATWQTVSAGPVSYCRSSYGPRCPTCESAGRAYSYVGGMYCTVCLQFCEISFRVTDAAGAVVQVQSTSVVAEDIPPLFLSVPQQLLYDLASHNPDAAMLLHQLSVRAATVAGAPPIRGDGAADRRATTAAAIEAIRGGRSDDQLRALTQAHADPSHHSAVGWELVRTPGAAHLVLTHRLMNDKSEIVGQPNKDVLVQLRWIPGAGKAGHWLATAWTERP